MFERTFKRGPGPLVSIMLPTRGRPKWMCEAIDSLYSLAIDKTLMEFILKIDSDDKETIDVANRLAEVLPMKIIVSPRGNGYHDMHHWVNDMCAIATGDWLYIFNDDARMITHGWDRMLLEAYMMVEYWHGIPDVCLLITPTPERPGATEFGFLRRRVYEILGHWSLSPHNDNWIYQVMSFIKSAYAINMIKIDHFIDLATDDVSIQRKKAYETAIFTLASMDATKHQLEDVTKLFNYISTNSTEEPEEEKKKVRETIRINKEKEEEKKKKKEKE